jgi:hypothetical protein
MPAELSWISTTLRIRCIGTIPSVMRISVRASSMTTIVGAIA